jgi:protein-S-isoprenylcysteine O-methyltransferase Ste14
MLGDLPQTLVVWTVWSYWTGVVVMMLRSHLRYRTAAGGLPRTRWERGMWLVWLPAVLLWQVLPPLAAWSSAPLWAIPAGVSGSTALQTLRWGGAVAALVAFLFTVPCWLVMGRNWSMAVVPTKRSRLVTEGMFARVRHPIYGLSMLLMVSTMVVVPSPAMLVVGALHLLMLVLKASSEEKYLRERHGQEYLEYCRRTGRFLPRLRAAA